MLMRQLVILMLEQIGMSLQIRLSHLLISLPMRLPSLSSLMPLGTTKFLYFQVGLFVKHPWKENDDSSAAAVSALVYL